MVARPLVAVVLLALAAPVGAASGPEWLSLCGKCLNPTVTAKTGLGTEQAVAEARVTREAAQAWCSNWQPDDKTCLKQQLGGEQGKVYRASADCLHGKLGAVDGNAYSFAGFWSSDVGRGRSKWKGPDGNVVGQDEASGGLALAQQWELLCPGVTKITSGWSAPGVAPEPQQAPVVQAQMAAAPAPMAAAPSQFAPTGDASGSAFSTVDAPPTGAQALPAGQGQMVGAAPAASPCAAPRCFNAGAFTATVTQLLEGQVGPKRDPAVRIGISFRNTGAQPLVLAYAAGSSVLVDSVGSHFTLGPPNTPDSSAQGIGKVEGKNADTRFVLQPGEARDAMFQLLKDKPGRAAAAGATRYNYAVGIAQLDVTGGQVRMVRGYRLGFQGLPPGADPAARSAGATSSASLSDAVKDLESAAKKFGELFDGKK
jgi:hypothetical protein